MKLPVLILFGLLASLAGLGAFVWLFAWYETRNAWPISHTPPLSQNQWFEILRNAVTAAAAVGVGVTLVLSYRRQRTAEETQRIGAEAQRTAAEAQKTAAKALELSNKQHELDQDRRRDAVTSELRARYAQAAEQLGSSHLSLRLAGVYSLAALADDWAEAGHLDERQVCIDLLGAHIRSVGPNNEDLEARVEVVQAAVDAVAARLKADTPARKYWGRSLITLRGLPRMPNLDGVVISAGGSLRIEQVQATEMSHFQGVDLNEGGYIYIQALDNDFPEFFSLADSRLAGGAMVLDFAGSDMRREGPPMMRNTLQLIRANLTGAQLTVLAANGWDIEFEDCVFESGRLAVRAKAGSVAFKKCVFKGNVFGEAAKATQFVPVAAGSMSIEDCRFENGSVVLKPYGQH